MKFNPYTTELDEGLLFKSVSECGRIEIGVYPVLFGFRIRAGFAGNMWYGIDYCCGSEQEDVEFIYTMTRNILEQQEFSQDIFKVFPYQERKPFFTDLENFDKFLRLIKAGPDFIDIKLPDIYAAKREYLNQYL